MPCCKAEQYKWCKDQTTVFKDEEGKDYCVFHAPKGEKGKMLQDFNKLIFERIDEAKKNKTVCDLSGTVFKGDIDFYKFNENNPLPEIKFSKAIFTGVTTFIFSQFGDKIDFSFAEFKKDAHFGPTKFERFAAFVGAKFYGTAYFIASEFKKARFDNLKITKNVIFEDANLTKVSFNDTDLRMIDFINCTWPKKLIWGVNPRIVTFRDVLYDELELFSNIEDYEEDKSFYQRLKSKFKGSLSEILKRELSGFKKDISCDKEKIKKVEILYRMLKQKYKEEHNDPEVSNWHYGEKEMYRKGSRFRRFFLLSLSNLYWLSSGYGERPFRSGIVLSLLIIAISVLFGLTGLKPINSESVIEIKEWADIWKFEYLKATIEYATFESKPDFIPLNWFLKIAAKLLIPLQTALFALAVRNRFRR